VKRCVCGRGWDTQGTMATQTAEHLCTKYQIGSSTHSVWTPYINYRFKLHHWYKAYCRRSLFVSVSCSLD